MNEVRILTGNQIDNVRIGVGIDAFFILIGIDDEHRRRDFVSMGLRH